MDRSELFTDGEAYERMMGRWSRLVGETFLAWLDLSKGLRWLDVGCGNGAFTEDIIARCAPATVMAIDPSNEQLAFARTRHRALTSFGPDPSHPSDDRFSRQCLAVTQG